jgi:hypothetical protein
MSFQSRWEQWSAVSGSRRNIHQMDNFYAYGYCTKHILRMYFSCSELTVLPVSVSVSSVYRFESICKFLHFLDNSYQDTHEGPQKLFKMCPIIRHLNSKFNKTDGSLTLWKDSLSFNLYLPLKLSQFRGGGSSNCINQVLVICDPPQFILEKRQVYSHPTFQKTQQK